MWGKKDHVSFTVQVSEMMRGEEKGNSSTPADIKALSDWTSQFYSSELVPKWGQIKVQRGLLILTYSQYQAYPKKPAV